MSENKEEKIRRRRELNKKHRLCTICPIRGGENARNERKHGRRKPKYKDKR